MTLETIKDIPAWVESLAQDGATAFGNAELRRALQLLIDGYDETRTRLDAIEATNAETRAHLGAGREARAQADDDLDLFQAGYERGYRQGWQHALDAKEERDAR